MSNADNLHAPRWTAHEERVVRQMWEDGATAQEIGERIGRSAKAVWCRAICLGLRRYEDAGGYEPQGLRLPEARMCPEGYVELGEYRSRKVYGWDCQS